MNLKAFIKLNCLSAIMVLGLGITSCGNSNGVLTESDVENEIERICAPLFKFYNTTEIQTGYYELNSADDRKKLREMEAAGLITYSAERFIEKVTKTKSVKVVERYYYNWWSGRQEPIYTYVDRNYTEDVEHIFVKVALTEEGQRYVVTDEELENIQEEIKKFKIDEDLICPNDETEYPEDAVSDDETIETILDEGETKEPVAGSDNTVANDSTAVSEEPEQSAVDATAGKDGSAYERALMNVQTTSVNVELYRLGISKVRKIRCTTKMFEKGDATAQVIFEYVDVTPFGRIISDKRDGEKISEDFEFILYTSGWVIKEN